MEIIRFEQHQIITTNKSKTLNDADTVQNRAGSSDRINLPDKVLSPIKSVFVLTIKAKNLEFLLSAL